jgi:hypothetical protein
MNKADLEWLIELQRSWRHLDNFYHDSFLMKDVIRELVQLRRQACAGDALAIASRNMFGPTRDKKGNESDVLDDTIDKYHEACKSITEEELTILMNEIVQDE